MRVKKVVLFFIAVVIIGLMAWLIVKSGIDRKKSNGKIQVVVSNFACFDFLRAIIGDDDSVELTFLVGPGKDAHSYSPGPQDMVNIKNADMFVYIGGDSENWCEDTIKDIDRKKTRVICIADFVDKMKEEDIDGAEEEDEEETEGSFEDHIWTSPSNAIKMVEALEGAMEEINPDNSEKYRENSEAYIAQIRDVDSKIRDIVDNRVRDTLIFGDKMPMQYFINYYGLKVSAAFNGCSTDTEPSAKTRAYLETKVRDEKIPVVLYIELNNNPVAAGIAEAVGNGCRAMQIQTLHNVSLDDFKNGETWVSLMTRNLDVLRAALQ